MEKLRTQNPKHFYVLNFSRKKRPTPFMFLTSYVLIFFDFYTLYVLIKNECIMEKLVIE